MLEDLGLSESTSTLIVWLVRALLPFLLFIIWYATQPPEPQQTYHRGQLLAARQVVGGTPPELGTLQVKRLEDPKPARRSKDERKNSAATSVTTVESRLVPASPVAKITMLNLAPPLVEHEEVQEAPKPEKKEGSDVMEDLQGVLSFIAFKERQQRVFLPVTHPPAPRRKNHQVDVPRDPKMDARQNAAAQRLLKALLPPSTLDLDVSQLIKALREKLAEVEVTKETYVSFLKLCLESRNLREVGRFYGEMEAKGLELEEEITDQVIALYATSALQ